MKIDRRKLRGWLYRNATPVNVEYGDVFCYTLSTQTVTVSEELPLNINWYINHCKHLGMKYDVQWWVLCLLHEIGHDQTIFFLNEFEYLLDWASCICETPSFTMFGAWLKNQIYFRLPAERAATNWVVDLVNNHIDEVRELERYVKVSR